jgi:hypothetical protein
MAEPVPETPAWVCDRTGKLFLTKDEYVGHLRALAKTRNAERRLKRLKDNFDCTVDRFRFGVRTIRDIESWLLANLEMVADCSTHRYYRRDKRPMLIRQLKLTVGFDGYCSNSHSAPRGRRTNWGRREADVPFGYPGFSGNVKVIAENWFDSSLLGQVGVHTGTGGGNGANYHYATTIWAEDFPNLHE